MSSAVGPSSKTSPSLLSSPDYLGGLSYAEVVANRVDYSRVYWRSSIKFQDKIGTPSNITAVDKGMYKYFPATCHSNSSFYSSSHPNPFPSSSSNSLPSSHTNSIPPFRKDSLPASNTNSIPPFRMNTLPASHTGSLPSTSNTASIPSTSNTASIPSTSNTASIPSTSNTASIPSTSNTASIPSTSSTASIPSTSCTASIPSTSRSVCAIIPGVERGLLSVSEKAEVQNFVSKLRVKGSRVGRYVAKRYEWLFADRNYRYGERLIEPCAAFSEVGHLCEGVVRDLQLAAPNACLLVYYPRGSSGLNLHKDDEPVHACDQVITLCHGVGATLVLADNSKQQVAREWLKGGDFYVFRDQRSFHHGIDGVESTGKGRWAFTFRVFKQSSENVKFVPTPKSVES